MQESLGKIICTQRLLRGTQPLTIDTARKNKTRNWKKTPVFPLLADDCNQFLDVEMIVANNIKILLLKRKKTALKRK